MTKEQTIALDIYTYLYRTYFGTSKEEIKYRQDYGSNGVIMKVLDYINHKYIKDDVNE